MVRGRWARVSRVENQLEELNLRQAATRQRVEQRVRSLLQGANSSFIGIALANASAQAAARNLELVTDSYAQGVVGILALLDAQNRALDAKLAAANAGYAYLIDLMGVQRAVGNFDYYRTPTGTPGVFVTPGTVLSGSRLSVTHSMML